MKTVPKLQSARRLRTSWVGLLLALNVPGTASAESRTPERGLTQSYARWRAEVVQDVAYELGFQLDSTEKSFRGEARLRFTAKEPVADLSLDFVGGRINGLWINGKAAKIQYNGLFLSLPKAPLRAGENEVRVLFSHPYSSTGEGLHRFRDPEDQRDYLYTDFEPYNANQLFPCFDQPDLKASYQLEVEAPQSWKVITAEREERIEPRPKKRSRWIFPRTLRFSTYLFALHAGDYQIFELPAAGTEKMIPLRLYVRQSLARFVDHEEWAAITRGGFAFYEKLFGLPYPFNKYDQVVAPELNYEAMENVGAVTFTEEFVPRGEMTGEEREGRARTILHELAHMWFGNLVTMRWWDDLWLNESFATYVAAIATQDVTEFKDPWLSFLLGQKRYAYWEDQLVTTHPIEAPVKSTEEAFSNFDGITYGKGAAVLRQLSLFVGEESFWKGVRAYFLEHAFKNTERRHFVHALERASGRDLTEFTEGWLKTSGPNTLKSDWSCAAGKLASLSVAQTQPLRAHRFQLALYGKDGGKLVPKKVHLVDLPGEKIAPAGLMGVECPELVLPNFDDHAYAQVELDPRSLEALTRDLSKVTPSLSRLLLWLSLWEQVRDAKLAPSRYVSLALAHLPTETEPKIQTFIVFSLVGVSAGDPAIRLYLPPAETVQEPLGPDWERIEVLVRERAFAKQGAEDRQRIWLDAFLRIARQPSSLEPLLALAADQNAPAPIDPERRWRAIRRLSILGHPKAPELIKSAREKDGSLAAARGALAAEVSAPDKGLKKKWLERVQKVNSGLSQDELRTVLVNLFPEEQWALRKELLPDFAARLKGVAKSRENELSSRFARTLAPASCDGESAKALEGLVSSLSALPSAVVRELKVVAQEDRRCADIRTVDAQEKRPR